jgi:hypothetical protein
MAKKHDGFHSGKKYLNEPGAADHQSSACIKQNTKASTLQRVDSDCSLTEL